MKTDSLRMDHLAVPVFDAAATHRFYSEVMRLPLVDAFAGDDWGGRAWLMMIYALADGRQLALCALRGATATRDDLPRDVRHIAFAVGSRRDLASWRKRLRSNAIEFWEEDHGSQRSLYFGDPNGHTLEITVPPSGARSKPNARAAILVEEWCGQVAGGFATD